MHRSERIYRALLRLYPEGVRREFGDPMRQLFREQLRDSGQGLGAARFWIRIVADVLKTAPASHFEHRPVLRNRAALAIVSILTAAGAWSIKLSGVSPALVHVSAVPWPYSLVTEIAAATLLDALILAPATAAFLLLAGDGNARRWGGAWLLSIPVVAGARLGYILFMTLMEVPPKLRHLPPYEPVFVLRYFLQWAPLYCGLAASMWISRVGDKATGPQSPLAAAPPRNDRG